MRITDRALAWRSATVLVLVNLVGATVYEWLVSRTWVISREREAGLDPASTGDAVIWMSIAVPILSCFLALNGGWGAVILWYRQWRAGRLWLVSFLIWLIALVIDYLHH